MRYNKSILKGISVFLIVLLMQKTEGSLYLHDWLHAQKITRPSNEFPSLTEKAIACTCIDDFYTPFAESPALVIQQPQTIQTVFVVIPALPIPFSPTNFHSLRGPPLRTC